MQRNAIRDGYENIEVTILRLINVKNLIYIALYFYYR